MGCKKTTIGGQALIEGIMMKGPSKTVIAIRTPDKSIETVDMQFSQLKDKSKFFRIPIIRGIVGFIESMVSGYKALMISAEKSGFADISEEQEDSGAQGPTEQSLPEQDKNGEKKQSVFLTVVSAVSGVLGVIIAVVLFMWIPTTLFNLFNQYIANGTADDFKVLFEGLLKLAIFVGYISAVSRMKDIKRVFMYHGAEHKTIFCYEKGNELTVENVRNNSRFHPRCGTSFLILMLFVGFIVNLILDIVLPDAFTSITALWVAIKIVMLPLICGIGYELIKICGRYENTVTKIISAPGMWMQRLTTKEPDDDMIEVAIVALTAVKPDNPDEDCWR
ncbi:MAG: DUF1385 domain-containing protein [bacterium]|nr:DUF1385 domain-containing protein [bacterium]